MQDQRTSANVPLDKSEREELKKAARREGIPMAAYIRWAALKVARTTREVPHGR